MKHKTGEQHNLKTQRTHKTGKQYALQTQSSHPPNTTQPSELKYEKIITHVFVTNNESNFVLVQYVLIQKFC